MSRTKNEQLVPSSSPSTTTEWALTPSIATETRLSFLHHIRRFINAVDSAVTMEDRTEVPDIPKFLPINLPNSLLSRRSVDGGERLDAHTHRELPLLRRSATATGASRSRSTRYSDGDTLQPLTPATTSGHSNWPSGPSPSSPGVSGGRMPSLLEYERAKMRRAMTSTPDVTSQSSDSRFTGDISVVGPDSPEDATDFKRSLEINMKDLVGDAVGNVSSYSFFCALSNGVDEYKSVFQGYRSRSTKRPLHHRPRESLGSPSVPTSRWHLGCCRRAMEPSSQPVSVHRIDV